MDPQRLQHQHHAVHVRSLYFGNRILLELVRKGPLRIQPETGPWLGATSSSRPLRRLRLGNGRHYERFNTRTGVVGLLLAKPGIYNIADPVDGQRRLRNICTDHDLPRVFWGGLEDLGLLFGR